MLLRSLLVVLAGLSLAFAVTPAQAAQVQLAWDAPAQANGTPVPSLAGYKLYYGSQSGQYQTPIPIGMTTTYTVTNLSAGQTYYFAVKDYDSTGTESALSNEVSVTLPTNTSVAGLIPQQQMRVVSVDSQDVVGGNYAATNAIDGNPATFWHTAWYQQTAPLPHTLVLDLGGPYLVDGFRYLPRHDGTANGTIAGYQFSVSLDGITWGTAVAAGTLAADTTEKTVRFTAKPGRYVRLVAVSEMNGGPWTSAAELNVFGTIVTPKPSVTFSAAPASIASGLPSTLTWSATNATSCSAAWTTATATAGAQSVKPTATTTYTLTCTGTGGTTAASTVVTVTPKPSVTFSAAPASIASGLPSTLTWSATNATSCSAAWTTATATAGAQSVKPTATTTYTLTCTGTGGTTAASTVVTVTPKPSVTFSAAPASIASGLPSTLTWSATNATSCSAAWTTATATAGAQSVKPTATTTYTLTCTGTGGTTAASTVVTVTPKPSVTFSAAPASIASGLPSTLTWSATNATSCSAAWTTATATAGAQSVKPTATTTYTLTCTGTGGTTAASTVVTVTPKPSVTFSAAPASIASGLPSTLTWSATNATSCSAAWTTATATAGAQSVKPTATTTYTLTCTGTGGTTAASTVVTVTPKPSVTFSAAPASIASGLPSTLTWSATNATSCSAAWTTATATAGAQSVKPTATTTYTLTCTGTGGTAAASTTVSINTLVSSLIPQQQLHVVSVDSQDVIGGNYAATNAIDGNPATFWHTEWYQRTAPLPHTLVLDLGGPYQVDGFRYLPRQDGTANGTIAGYQFSVSLDGITWGTAVAAGTLAADTTEKTVRFTAKPGRYVRLVAVSEMNGGPWTSAAELNVFGTAAPASTTTTSSLLAQPVTTALVASSTSTSPTTTGTSTTSKAPTTVVSATPLSSTMAASQSSTKTAAAPGAALTPSSPPMTVSQNTPWELTLTSTKLYANPFLDVTVSVEYTKAGAPTLQGSGFWDGDATFTLRQAFPAPGTWHYHTTATDPSDSGLHNREGDVHVLPYTGTNPLYRHGFLQVSADRRFLAYADGTPFLWLGDTLWGATVWLTEAGFHAAVADRRAKHFTVLQTNFARQDAVDTAGDTPWQGDRWNVRFMQKLDRMFNDANDQGMYLFVNGLVDLVWDRGIPHYDRLVEMIGARYAAHFVSFASSMDDPYDPLHAQLNAALQRTAPRTLLAQHPGTATNGQGPVWTAEQYYDTPFVDYVMDVTGGEGDLDVACQHAIDWSLRLYHHVPPKPVVNGTAWYEGVAGGTAEMTAQLGYLSLLSGNVGYTYGTSLWNATDADLPTWQAVPGATYMQYLYDFFAALDGGRPFQPRHELITNQATRYQDRMVVGVAADGLTYVAFLPKGGTISVDLTALAGTTVGVTWYNPLTGQYHDQGTTSGGAVRALVSPFGTSQAALVLMAQ